VLTVHFEDLPLNLAKIFNVHLSSVKKQIKARRVRVFLHLKLAE
jgi:hypothetical protein